ncbi:MAG: hypothetical protein PHV11_06280 [Candidatus Bipolaricaulis sp.]|nr:hypothetical protein [Candidatus Bipolaricaulis sp.]
MSPELVQFRYKGTKLALDIKITAYELTVAAMNLIDELYIEYEKKLRNGLTQKAAADDIYYSIINGEGVAKAFENKQNKIIAKLTKELVAQPANQFANENPDKLFDWVLGSVKTSHCPDCIKLSGMEPRTIKGWRELGYGLPREGETECSYGCQCMLQEADQK